MQDIQRAFQEEICNATGRTLFFWHDPHRESRVHCSFACWARINGWRVVVRQSDRVVDRCRELEARTLIDVQQWDEAKRTILRAPGHKT